MEYPKVKPCLAHTMQLSNRAGVQSLSVTDWRCVIFPAAQPTGLSSSGAGVLTWQHAGGI